MIRVVHARVEGRVRLRMPLLKGHPLLAKYLTEHLRAQNGVRTVRAGTTTGSLLVFYDTPLLHVEQVLGLVQEALNRFKEDTPNPIPPSSVVRNTPGKQTPPSPSIASSRSVETPPTHKAPRRQPAGMDHLDSSPDDAWHAKTPQACLTRLQSGLHGLSDEEVLHRLEAYGPNDVQDTPSISRWRLLTKQFISLPVMLLGAVSVVSLVTGGVADAMIIGGVVAANAIIGYITEKSSDEAISALRQREEPEAHVIRSGREQDVPRSQLVPGDIIVLRAGCTVPADGRLLRADHLFVDESSLSGESLPVLKSADVVLTETVPLHDRLNMVYRGTLVTGGSGVAVVTSTGARTQIGQLQRLLQTTEAPKAPIEYQLARLGRRLVLFCLGVCAVCFALGVARGYGLLAMARLSLSLGAAAVPEGLPSAATTTFALAVRRMRRRGVLIRDLTAVESLGAIQVLCVDKTGTLTENRMTVQEIVVDGLRYGVRDQVISFNGNRVDPLNQDHLRRILEISSVCIETRGIGQDPQGGLVLDGSPTETALIRLALANGVPVQELRENFPPYWTILRSESRPYMATLQNNDQGELWLAVKGNPEAVLACCTKEIRRNTPVTLTDERRRRILQENEQLSSQGLRVLGFAYGFPKDTEHDAPEDLIWCGLVGMADPIKAGARETIRTLRRAGVEVVMLTGDQELTATAVANALELSGGKPVRTVNASCFNGGWTIDSEELKGCSVHVFSRVSPAHKLQIVDMLRRSGKIVGMTGDGINDAPALKAADVGICMGQNGIRAAQQVANVILENDDLTLLAVALEEGRTIQNNIRKSVRFFLSSNLSEILVTTSALFLGMPTLLNPMQLLWINLVSDVFPGIALSMDPPEPDVLLRPPRKAHDALFSASDFARMFRDASVLAGGALLGSFYGLLQGGPAKASTTAFHILSGSQLAHALVCRREDPDSTKSSGKAIPILRVGIAATLFAQILAGIVPGLRNFLGLTPMHIVDWLIVALATLTTTWVNTKAGQARSRTPRQVKIPSEEPVEELSAFKVPGPDIAAVPQGPMIDVKREDLRGCEHIR